MIGETIALVPERLYALPLVYALDRPTSAHPFWARGFATVNCYLLREADTALLIDTGFPALASSLFRQLDELLDSSTRLSVLVLRVGEMNSVANLAATLERYRVECVYAAGYPELAFVCHDPRPYSMRPEDAVTCHERTTLVPIKGSATVSLGEDRAPQLEVFRTSLQMIASQQWAYDSTTGTMFTSEAFSHVWRSDPTGPWVVDVDNPDSTTVRGLCDFLVGTRFWWLAGADTGSVWRSLEGILARPIARICPAVGCVLSGTGAVERHINLLRTALERLADHPSSGMSLMPV